MWRLVICKTSCSVFSKSKTASLTNNSLNTAAVKIPQASVPADDKFKTYFISK